MKTIIKAIILANLLVGFSSLKAQNLEWAKSFGSNGTDCSNSITLDDYGNIYTTGLFEGTVDFDPGTGTTFLTENGGYDVFVLKMDPLGDLLWVKSFGSFQQDQGISIAVDVLGNVYTIGFFHGAVDFDPGLGITQLISVADFDIFVQKMDADGNFLWAKSFGGTSPLDIGQSISVDIAGNVYSTGYFSETVDFDPGLGTAYLTSAGDADCFVQKMDTDGNFLWAKTFGGSGEDEGRSITVDDLGNVYTTGGFSGTVDFDNSAETVNLTSQGNKDVFVLKLDTSGNILWAKSFGGGSIIPDIGRSIKLDASGNVFTIGDAAGTIDFDPGPETNLYSSLSSGSDIFVHKMDASGNFIWVKNFGGPYGDNGASISLDHLGNIYTTGSFMVIADFDPGDGIANSYSVADMGDTFIQKMDSLGNFVWAKTFGGHNNSEGFDICVDGTASVYGSGYFTESVDFDPGPGTAYFSSENGSYDIFILKLTQAEVAGYVFVDTNEDGLKDADEMPFPGQNIIYGNANSITNTNNEGFFSIGSALGDQTFTLHLPSYYTNTNPLSQTVDVQIGAIDTLYFGLKAIPGANDLTVDIHPYTEPRPGFTRNYQISYQNVGTTILNEVTLKFLKDEEDNILSATGTYTVSNDTLIWIIGTLEPFSYGNFTITNTLSATATLGDSTLTQAWIIPAADDATPENNVVALSEEIIGSYDPNDKSVTPEVSEPTENEPLEYLVRFQNTGNHQADFVIVRDTLSTLLDLTTFQMIAASHNYELAIENRIAVWTFPQINLPDSTSDEPGSHGFIKFKVQRVDGLGLGTQIPNRVGIYFDYNAPVITNTCIYSIETCPSSAIDVQTACNSYTWIDGNTYTTSNNTATHILTNVAGCDSIVTLNLTVNSVSNIGTTTNGATITANNNSATYQWIDCDNNNEPIEGATNQTFTATESGNYAVELTENGCTSTSACVAVTVIGIDELSNGLHAVVYPNPSQGNIEITLGSIVQDVELMLTDIQGRVIFTRNYPSLFKTNIELPDAKGVYVLKLKAQDSTSTLRLVKE